MVPKTQTEDEPASKPNEEAYQLILQATVKHIRSLTELHAPEDAAKYFLLWLLDPENPRYIDYLQLSGISKMAELGAYWLKDLFDQETIVSLAHYLGVLNTYFFFEVISDNLAIGLARPSSEDRNWYDRREILFHFNNVIQKKLAGATELTFFLLKPLTEKINQISCFNQSLTANELENFAQLFLELNPVWSLQSLDKSAMTYLVLNIESCLYCLKVLTDESPLRNLLFKSLGARYQAVNSLLQMHVPVQTSLLTQWGIHSILVIPTLLYLVAVLNTNILNQQLIAVIGNGVLLQVLEKAALSIRLLNDIGTHLLSMSDDELDTLEQEAILAIRSEAKNFSDVFSSLDFFSKQQKALQLFARIRKDLVYREFNICLDNLDTENNIENNLTQFFANIKYYAALYKSQRAELEILLKALQDHRIAQLIMKMVVFHEHLYAKEFEKSQGDYATRY